MSISRSIFLKSIILFSRNAAIFENCHVNNLTLLALPSLIRISGLLAMMGDGTFCVKVPKDCHIFSTGDLCRMTFVSFLWDFDVVMLAHVPVDVLA